MLLVVFHAYIALAYAALTNSRQSYLREQTETGEDSPPRLHITYQLTLILVRFTIAALAVTALGQGLFTGLTQRLEGVDADLVRAVAYIIVLLPTALITLVLGDLVPAAIGSTRADQVAPWVVAPMRFLLLMLNPVVTLIVSSSKALASIFGSSSMVNVFTEEEIMTLLDAGQKEGTIEHEEKEMIYSVLQFGDTLAREVMVPRIDIVAVDMDTTLDEAINTFMKSGHSRIPVYEDSVDNIKGLLYAKDMLNLVRQPNQPDRPIREIMRKAFFAPESKRADELFKELQSAKIHMAVVVDEYGGTAGIVTIEDLIEEIVGDIQDEYDVHEEAEYVEHTPDEYTIDASMNLADFNDRLKVELPTEDSDTLGGFIFTQLGRVPEVGERLEHGSLLMRIESLEGRRIRKVHVTRRAMSVENRPESADSARTAPPQPQPITEQ
jgi:putative hemolysin